MKDQKRRCPDCSKLSDLLFAANEREGKKIVELAQAWREIDLLQSKLLQAEAKAQVQRET